jgi:regulator of replication initiation timing
MDARIFDQLILENRTLKLENDSLSKLRDTLQNNLQNCQELLMEKTQTTSKELEELKKENQFLKIENEKLKVTIEKMGINMKEMMEKISKVEDEQQKSHKKKSLLGQLAFGTERLILEQIYGIPLDRIKSKYKLKDIEGDNLGPNEKKKWEKIKQSILNFDLFLDTAKFLKCGRLDNAHPDKNLDQTEVTEEQIKEYFEEIYKGEEYFDDYLSDITCMIDLNKQMSKKKQIIFKK